MLPNPPQFQELMMAGMGTAEKDELLRYCREELMPNFMTNRNAWPFINPISAENLVCVPYLPVERCCLIKFCSSFGISCLSHS